MMDANCAYDTPAARRILLGCEDAGIHFFEEPMLEYDRSSHPFREDLIHGAIRMVNGKVAVPQAPGIGVEIDRDVLCRYGRRAR
jgi:L-alanine-DL-glutamate epimerase-like enolase superfamily enzyme